MHATFLTDLPPELYATIASFLEDDRRDLYSCTLASHDWHSIFNPILWRDIKNDPASLLLSGAAATGSLTRYGHYIQHLELACQTEDFGEFLALAPTSLPLLRSIELIGQVDSDEMIGDLLRRCSRRHGGGVGLQRLVFEPDGYGGYFDFRRKSVEALMEHVSTLEVFCVEKPWISSREIQQLLRSTPRLKVFYILPRDRNERIDLSCCLNANDVVHPEWACTSLEVFGCPIGGIPRPDIAREIHDGPVSKLIPEGDHQESLALHTRVYSQLARLTYIRELRMGIPYDTHHEHYHRYDRESDRQYDCLAMSLESGLDILRGLKNLEVVALEDMEVSIDAEDELKWATQHWPNAEVATTEFSTDQDTESTLLEILDRSSYSVFEYEDDDSYGDYDDDNYDDYDYNPYDSDSEDDFDSRGYENGFWW
ncbi:MAG: hypothetical protein J3R72DRAFT_449928 [Linnemannia gamsii]|nr:MAG: hypothetical protein J3R72DRAFT_449928 [Linnemannia gamsii]